MRVGCHWCLPDEKHIVTQNATGLVSSTRMDEKQHREKIIDFDLLKTDKIVALSTACFNLLDAMCHFCGFGGPPRCATQVALTHVPL